MRCYQQYDYEGASVSKIASAAGNNGWQPLLHFPSKVDLLGEALQRPLSDDRVQTVTSLLPAMAGKVIAQYAEGDAVRKAFQALVLTDDVINTAWVSVSFAPRSGDRDILLRRCGAGLIADPDAAFAVLDQVVERAVGAPVSSPVRRGQELVGGTAPARCDARPAQGIRATVTGILGGQESPVHFMGNYTDAPMSGTQECAFRSGCGPPTRCCAHPTSSVPTT